MRILLSSAVLALCVPLTAVGSHFETIFDGGIPATEQGWNVIGGEYQSITTAPFNTELLIDTTDDGSLISGVYGPIPRRQGSTGTYHLDIGILQYSELNTPPDGTSLSVIIVGDDPAKSLHIGVGFGRIWYYDNNFNPSAPLLDLGPDLQVRGGLYVSWLEDSATISNFDISQPIQVPLFDYRPASSSRHPSIAGIYTQPNTLFIGDDSQSESTFVWLSRSVIEYHPSPVPILPAYLLLVIPCFGVLRRCRRRTSI